MLRFFVWLKLLLFSKGQVTCKTLDNVSAEEIRLDIIKAEQKERQICHEIEEFEKRKELLFAEGVNSGSDRQKMQCARKIKELDGQVKGNDQVLIEISKELRILHGLAQLKRRFHSNGQKTKSLITRINFADLRTIVEQATVGGQLRMEILGEIIGAMDAADAASGHETYDPDHVAIVEDMHRKADQQVREGALASEPGVRSGLVSVGEAKSA